MKGAATSVEAESVVLRSEFGVSLFNLEGMGVFEASGMLTRATKSSRESRAFILLGIGGEMSLGTLNSWLRVMDLM